MQVENFQKLMDTVAQIDEQGRKAVKATVRDIKACLLYTSPSPRDS